MGGLFAASGWGRRPLRWVQAALIGGWMTMGAAYGAEPLEAWPSVPPESAGLSEARLKAAWENLAARRTKAFLVVRGGRIVFERYAEDFGPNRKHYTASLAKALVGGLSLAIASADGRIAPDDRAARYIPAWQDDPIRSRITIRHLATHTSGIEDAEEDGLPHERLPGWKGAFWRQDQNPFLLARDEASVLFEPGTDYAYSNPGMAMLAYAVTAALEGTEHPDLRTLLRERLFRPLGIPDSAWSIGYERTFETEGLPLVPNWGGGGFTARATARIGQLLLQEGRWAGRELIAPQWVRRAITDAGMPRPPRSEAQPAPASGMGFYTNNDRVWENVPSDAFAGAGAGHQVMIVVPSLELVIVRYGGTLDRNGESLEFWGQIKAQVLDPVMAAFLDPAVVQEASVQAERRVARVLGIRWAPPETILRLAEGSDNWPLAWADDGNLYTSYGDGWGFEPRVPEKLGMGFARVIGDPPEIRGENIRSNGENRGSGRSGKKSSGLLAVGNTLYLLVKSVDGRGNGTQIARSEDFCRTWVWADWSLERLGYAAWIDFGQGHHELPDPLRGYAYFVSPDGPSGYEPADGFVLARAPIGRLMEREAYEFFVGLSPSNGPVWGDFEQRRPIYEAPDRCLRHAMTYSRALGRYLWWQQVPPTQGSDRADSRFAGGFTVLEAPAPWGPWTPVYATLEWDVGPGERGSFPTKWMAPDGSSAYLVFSGDDTFAVRKASFLLRGSKPVGP